MCTWPNKNLNPVVLDASGLVGTLCVEMPQSIPIFIEILSNTGTRYYSTINATHAVVQEATPGVFWPFLAARNTVTNKIEAISKDWTTSASSYKISTVVPPLHNVLAPAGSKLYICSADGSRMSAAEVGVIYRYYQRPLPVFEHSIVLPATNPVPLNSLGVPTSLCTKSVQTMMSGTEELTPDSSLLPLSQLSICSTAF